MTSKQNVSSNIIAPLLVHSWKTIRITGGSAVVKWSSQFSDLNVCDLFSLGSSFETEFYVLWEVLRDRIHGWLLEAHRNLIFYCVRPEIATFPIVAFEKPTKVCDSFLQRCSLCTVLIQTLSKVGVDRSYSFASIFWWIWMPFRASFPITFESVSQISMSMDTDLHIRIHKIKETLLSNQQIM